MKRARSLKARPRAVVLMVAVSVTAGLGCAASSRAKYGTKATYLADDRAWVVQGEGGKFTLRYPMGRCVIQCREHVERFKAVIADQARVSNRNDGAPKTAFLLTLPTSIPMLVLGIPFAGVGKALSQHPGDEYFNRGKVQWANHELDKAAESFLLAVAHGQSRAAEPLAQVLIAQGNLKEARKVRDYLLCVGGSLGDETWTAIETWMKEQGTHLGECADPSREPVEIPWLE